MIYFIYVMEIYNNIIGGSIMDIFEWADEYEWLADYMDLTTNLIYKIRDAKDTDRTKMQVVDTDGVCVGYVTRKGGKNA